MRLPGVFGYRQGRGKRVFQNVQRALAGGGGLNCRHRWDQVGAWQGGKGLSPPADTHTVHCPPVPAWVGPNQTSEGKRAHSCRC